VVVVCGRQPKGTRTLRLLGRSFFFKMANIHCVAKSVNKKLLLIFI